MPSVAETLITQGTAALRTVHGETLTRTPASDVVGTEYGEVVATEEGKAVLGGAVEAESFECNWFDEFYAEPSPDGVSVSALRPACEVSDDELSNPRRNDVITRNSVAYYVQSVQPDGHGNNLLLLSKNVH